MTPKALAIAAALTLAPVAATAAETGLVHIPSPPRPGTTVAPPFSTAVIAGQTVYLSGVTDGGTAFGGTPTDAAKRVLDSFKRMAEAAGVTMDDLVSVQIFASDLADYQAFNDVYLSYFKGPLPARAFIGAGSLLGGARFEVMGIAVRPAK